MHTEEIHDRPESLSALDSFALSGHWWISKATGCFSAPSYLAPSVTFTRWKWKIQSSYTNWCLYECDREGGQFFTRVRRASWHNIPLQGASCPTLIAARNKPDRDYPVLSVPQWTYSTVQKHRWWWGLGKKLFQKSQLWICWKERSGRKCGSNRTKTWSAWSFRHKSIFQYSQ